MSALHPCPICDTECVDYYRDVLDGHTLMSESYRCPNDHYWYDYDTGSTREIVGQREFIWSYTTSETRLKRLDKVVKKAIEKERQKWSSGL